MPIAESNILGISMQSREVFFSARSIRQSHMVSRSPGRKCSMLFIYSCSGSDDNGPKSCPHPHSQVRLLLHLGERDFLVIKAQILRQGSSLCLYKLGQCIHRGLYDRKGGRQGTDRKKDDGKRHLIHLQRYLKMWNYTLWRWSEGTWAKTRKWSKKAGKGKARRQGEGRKRKGN